MGFQFSLIGQATREFLITGYIVRVFLLVPNNGYVFFQQEEKH